MPALSILLCTFPLLALVIRYLGSDSWVKVFQSILPIALRRFQNHRCGLRWSSPCCHLLCE